MTFSQTIGPASIGASARGRDLGRDLLRAVKRRGSFWAGQYRSFWPKTLGFGPASIGPQPDYPGSCLRTHFLELTREHVYKLFERSEPTTRGP
jgi:hypothetical protein